ncbi:MAG: hypothetical protein ABGY11_13785 [Candidatus Thioglobus sp.]
MELGLPVGMITGILMMFLGMIGWVFIIMDSFDKKFIEDWGNDYD